MKKVLTFKEKIDKILKYRKLTINRIETKLDVDGTFRKAYNENREPNEDLVSEFLRNFRIRQTWWDEPVGDTEADIFLPKGTNEPSVETLNKKDPGDEVRILIKNLDRMGEMNEFLLRELKSYQDKFGRI